MQTYANKYFILQLKFWKNNMYSTVILNLHVGLWQEKFINLQLKFRKNKNYFSIFWTYIQVYSKKIFRHTYCTCSNIL
jgi:hypothetical protein